MKHIDLFSGIGGFALAATWVWGSEYENVGHSEIEKYPCKVYHNHFPESECLGDITKINWSRFTGTIDLVTGGFPCQPHSVAGKRKGSDDERDLWAECVRALRDIQPRFALFENVSTIISSNGGSFFNRVLTDIHESGYDCEWQMLSAAEVGAWHRRERIWITCSPSHILDERSDDRPKQAGDSVIVGRWRQRQEKRSRKRAVSYAKKAIGELSRRSWEGWGRFADVRKTISDTASEQDRRLLIESLPTNSCAGSIGRGQANCWISEPNVGRMAYGIPARMDRLKGLGNAIVPQCAAVIMERIKENM